MSENLLPVEHIITISYDDRAAEWALDIADVDHFEAEGILRGCLRRLESMDPIIKFRAGGLDVDDEEEE